MLPPPAQVMDDEVNDPAERAVQEMLEQMDMEDEDNNKKIARTVTESAELYSDCMQLNVLKAQYKCNRLIK